MFHQTLKLSKDLIEIQRNGYIFQIDASPFSEFRYKGRKKQTIAYKYSLGMHMIAGHGNMDSLEKIKVGEKVVWEGSAAPATTLKDYYNTCDDIQQHCYGSDWWLGQTFTPLVAYNVFSIKIKVFKLGNPTGNLIISIRATSGGLPIGEDLCSGTIIANNISETSAPGAFYEVIMDAPYKLSLDTQYALIIRVPDGSQYNKLYSRLDYTSATYAGGTWIKSNNGGVNWSSENTWDLMFEIYEIITNPTISINKPNIFGGDKKEGGVVGNVDLMFGDITQTQNSYLKARLDSDIPAYRGLWSAVLNQVYIGTSPYLKPWSFFLKRVNKQTNGNDQWYPAKAVIRAGEEAGDDLNAIHIIRECLINSEWGMGESINNIDDAYFKETADILYDEDFGLSMLWSSETSVEEFIDEILTYIAGMLYQDLETGKWKLVLIRDPDLTAATDEYGVASYDHQIDTKNVLVAQTFIASRNYSIGSVALKLRRPLLSHLPGVINVSIRTVEMNENSLDLIGGIHSYYEPTSKILTIGSIDGNTLTTDAEGEWRIIVFDAPVFLDFGSMYAIVISGPDSSANHQFHVRFDWPFATYSEGRMFHSQDGISWLNGDYGVFNNDITFRTYKAELETFNENDIIKIENYERPSYGEIIDKVTIKYWNKLAHKSRPTFAHDIALIEKQGGAIIEKILNYQGICDSTLANMVAERELNLHTSMLASMRIICTRKMAHLKPNDIFILSWSDLDITTMIVRILNVNYGNLEKNEVVFDCVEDVVSTAETIYGDSADTLWINPITNAVDVTNRKIIEIPYYTLCKDLLGSVSLVDALDNDASFISVVAQAPSGDSFDYDLLIRLSASFDFEDIGQGNAAFTPTGTITNNLVMNADDVTIDLSSETDLDLVTVDSLAIINDEILRVLAIDTNANQIQISRGILDTVPAAHTAGDIIYFMAISYSEVATEYTVGDTPGAKLLSRTGNGSLAKDDATIEIADALNSRAYRPYPPGNLKFQNERYPTYFSSTISGKMTITWTHRNRTHITQLNSLVKQTDAIDFGREGGTATYTVKVYDENNVLIRTVADITGSSYDYTEAFEREDCVLSPTDPLNKTLRFVIYTIRDSYDSFQKHDVTIERSLIGSIIVTSNLTGWIITYFDGRDNCKSNGSVFGSLNIDKGLIGSSAGASNINGSLKVLTNTWGEVITTSNVIGSLSVEIKLVGSVVAMSNVSSSLSVETGLIGSSNSILNVSGSLTMISP